MKRKLLALTFGLLTFLSCSDGETKKQLSELKTELEQTKAELNNCSAELTEIIKPLSYIKVITSSLFADVIQFFLLIYWLLQQEK
ncbi:hypothetical protein [Lacinutrix sp.]|uniref:hypothetical protein n=1 Tax=Lacinutrix sp. TaxID=1937692 RepID=UPI00260C1FEE|nr:hypothetical protein [Lacinutrix sp.]MDG1715340.1 hypothetical protein [Lacinutrix sp.]